MRANDRQVLFIDDCQMPGLELDNFQIWRAILPPKIVRPVIHIIDRTKQQSRRSNKASIRRNCRRPLTNVLHRNRGIYISGHVKQELAFFVVQDNWTRSVLRTAFTSGFLPLHANEASEFGLAWRRTRQAQREFPTRSNRDWMPAPALRANGHLLY